MAIAKVLILFTILTLFFINAQAQQPCNVVSQNMLQEPSGIFPNEVEGFKFFSEGKLSPLRLGVSTREDVEKIFGKPIKIENNEETYDFDADWSLIISYFDQKYSTKYISSLSFRDNKSIEETWVPVPEYIGKMLQVVLFYKKKIPFNQVPNPDIFRKYSYGDRFYSTAYMDNYGLMYTVSDWVNDKKDESQNRPSKGDLISIKYNIECPFQRKFYIKTK
jgi:hypothetical protein